MVQTAPLLKAFAVLSQLSATLPQPANGLAVRQSINPSDLPSACQSPCQVVNTLTNCNADLNCMCSSTIGSQLQQCMNCLISADPAIQSEAQSVISSWNAACNGNLSVSGGSSSGGSTGGTTGGTTTSTIPPTASGTSSGGGSASNPLGIPAGGAVSLKTGDMAVCIVAALVGAFTYL